MERDDRYSICIRSQVLFGGFLIFSNISSSQTQVQPQHQTPTSTFNTTPPNLSPPCRYFCLPFAIGLSTTLRLGLTLSTLGMFFSGKKIIRIKPFLSDGHFAASLLLLADSVKFILPQKHGAYQQLHVSQIALLFRKDVHALDGAFVTIQKYTRLGDVSMKLLWRLKYSIYFIVRP